MLTIRSHVIFAVSSPVFLSMNADVDDCHDRGGLDTDDNH